VNLTRKQAEFWAILIIACTIVAIAVLLIDFGIKTAILEESVKLRLKIEEWERGQHTETATIGATNDAPIDDSVPSLVLVDDPAGMETGKSPNNGTGTVRNTTSKRRAKPIRPTDAS
jgi:hypothetical protein